MEASWQSPTERSFEYGVSPIVENYRRSHVTRIRSRRWCSRRRTPVCLPPRTTKEQSDCGIWPPKHLRRSLPRKCTCRCRTCGVEARGAIRTQRSTQPSPPSTRSVSLTFAADCRLSLRERKRPFAERKATIANPRHTRMALPPSWQGLTAPRPPASRADRRACSTDDTRSRVGGAMTDLRAYAMCYAAQLN